MRPSLLKLRGMRLVVKGAGDQRIEVGIAGFTGSSDEIGALDGAELRADEDGSPLLGRALQISALR